MIIVLDTNVIVSAVLSPEGKSAEIIRHWEAVEFEVAISPALLQELQRALSYDRVRKYTRFTAEELEAFLEYFRSSAINIDPQVILEVIEKDPDDNRVLECAIESDASYIVTGDQHLLVLKDYLGITILPPAVFLTLLETGSLDH